MIRIILSDTRFHVVFYTLDPENCLTWTFLLLSILLVMSHPWTCLTMVSPNTRTFLISLVFVFLVVFLILSLLGLSVDTTTFVDFFVGFYRSGLLVIYHSVFFANFYYIAQKLRVLLLRELDFGFPFDDSRIGAITECEHELAISPFPT